MSPRFHWFDRAMVAATALITLVIFAPRLPPGICTGDSGGLQLASATLGITHPPGYAVFASIGFVFSRIPWLEPAYAVSLLCLVAGVAVVVGCALLQISLGVHAGLACCVALLLLAHPSMWRNLQVPEVYLPTLALQVTAAYLLMRYGRTGRRRDLLVSALLWGVALAARPPVIFMLPFIVAAWWCARRRRERSWKRSSTSLLLCLTAGAVPGLYTLGYLWVRDRPTTSFNYIEQYNREMRKLPAAAAGPAAKLSRIAWLTSGRQYVGTLTRNRPGLRARTRWLGNQLLPDRPATLVAAMAVVLFGAALAYKRSPPGFWVLAGMGIGGLVYLYVFPIHGDAADMLPLVFSMSVLAGVAISVVFPSRVAGVRHHVAAALFVAMSVFTLVDARSRSRIGASRDASAFLETLDLNSLPDSAAIYSTWHWSPALWYGATVVTKRSDLEIVNADMGAWLGMMGDPAGRPVFMTEPIDAPPGFRQVPYRNIWRLERAVPARND